MLLDLTSDYMRFLNTASLQNKRDKIAAMNAAMVKAGKSKQKSVVKAVFLEEFIQMLEVMITAEFDDKKFQKQWEKKSMEINPESRQLYSTIVSAIEMDDLQTWMRQVIEKRANLYTKDKDKAKADKEKRGFFGRFSSNSKASSAQESEALSHVEQMLQDVRQ